MSFDRTILCEYKGGCKNDCYALVASLVQRPGVKLQSDDGEYDDGEQHQQADLEQWSHGLDDGLQHDLQTYEEKQKNRTKRYTGHPGRPSFYVQ